MQRIYKFMQNIKNISLSRNMHDSKHKQGVMTGPSYVCFYFKNGFFFGEYLDWLKL
jgi:hypothetical protein